MVRVEREEDVSGVGAGKEVGVIGVLEGFKGAKVKRNSPEKLVFLGIIVEFRDFKELMFVKLIGD